MRSSFLQRHVFSQRAIAMSSLLIAVLAGLVSACHKSGPKLALKDATVEWVGAFTEMIECSSFARPVQEAILTVQKGGRVDSLRAQAGQDVHAGQIIATIDVTTNAADLKAKLSEYSLAAKEFARVRGLMQSRSATREEYDRAEGSVQVKRAALEQAKQTLEDAVVRTPIDGVLEALVFKLGDKIPDGGRLGMVFGRGGFRVACRFTKDVASRVPATAGVTIQLDAKDAAAAKGSGDKATIKLTATVERDEETDGFVGLDKELRFIFHEIPPSIRIGTPVKVVVALPQVEGVAKIPSLSVVTREGGEFVLARSSEGGADTGKLAWIPVHLIQRDPNFAYVSGVPQASQLVLIDVDLNTLEALVSNSKPAAEQEKKRM